MSSSQWKEKQPFLTHLSSTSAIPVGKQTNKKKTKTKKRDLVLINKMVHQELQRPRAFLWGSRVVLEGRHWEHLQGSMITWSVRLNNFPSITWYYIKKVNLNEQMDALFICQNELDVKTNLSPSYFSYQSFLKAFPHIFPSWAQPFLQGLPTQSLGVVDLLGESQPEKKHKKNSAFNLWLPDHCEEQRHLFTGHSDQHCTIMLWNSGGDEFTSLILWEQLIFTAFCLLLCALRNECVCEPEGAIFLPVLQIQQPEQQIFDPSPFREVPQN